jgi:hypothetical protein
MNKFRIWWTHPSYDEMFYVPVSGPSEAKRILGVLADYDNHLVSNGLIGDISNISGLEEFDEDSWVEWESNESCDIWGH